MSITVWDMIKFGWGPRDDQWKAQLDEVDEETGETPLIRAAEKCDHHLFEIILNACSPQQVNRINSLNGKHVLHYICQFPNENKAMAFVIKCLNYIKPNPVDKDAKTPLDYLPEGFGFKDTLVRLGAKSSKDLAAKPIEQPKLESKEGHGAASPKKELRRDPATGETILMKASGGPVNLFGNLISVSTMEELEAVNKKNGKHVLHYIMATGDPLKFQVYVAYYGTDGLNPLDKDGKTPLDCLPVKYQHLADSYRRFGLKTSEELKPKMESKEAMMKKTSLDEVDPITGETTIMRAVQCRNCNDFLNLLNACSKEQLHAVNKQNGKSVLHYVLEFGTSIKALDFLSKYGWHMLNPVDKGGKTPLDYMPEKDYLADVRARLVNNGAKKGSELPKEEVKEEKQNRVKKALTHKQFIKKLKEQNMERIIKWVNQCIEKNALDQLEMILYFRGAELMKEDPKKLQFIFKIFKTKEGPFADAFLMVFKFLCPAIFKVPNDTTGKIPEEINKYREHIKYADRYNGVSPIEGFVNLIRFRLQMKHGQISHERLVEFLNKRYGVRIS